jgi:hypothetical protein
MKRIAVLLALMLVSVAGFAQKVNKNERNENGVRTIGVPLRAFYVDNEMHGCFLEYREANGVEAYVLTFAISGQAYKWGVRKGNQILLKAVNGDVLEHTFLASTESRIVAGKSGATYHIMIPLYFTQEESGILDKGLVKIRIPRTTASTGEINNLDIVFPDDLTLYLKKAKKNIDKTIPLPVTIDKSAF